MNSGSREEMSDVEIAMRKVLKQLGVTAHQGLEAALAAAVADGKIKAGSDVPVSAEVTIPEIGFAHKVSATLLAPGSDG